MNDASSPEAWIEKAEHDFRAARQQLHLRQPLTDIASFHAQQCAEKYLKALLVKYEVEPPRTHDLVVLSSLCLSCGTLVPIKEEALIVLTRYAILTRYPGDDPTLEEAKYALDIAKAVRKFVKPLI